MNRTFFFSPDDRLPVGVRSYSVGADGCTLLGGRLNCLSSSSSASPGVATVDQATLVEECVRFGVRASGRGVVSMLGRFVL